MEQRKSPAVSVIMAIYNAEQYLHEAIESILQQSFTDFELLLLNDGSTDGSVAILESFAERDKRCRLINRSNMQRARIRNEGVSLARGEVLMIMDADDICLPNRFAVELAYLAEHPECVAVGSKVLLVDAEGEPLREFVDAYDHDAIDEHHMLGQGGTIIHPTVAIRKQAFLQAGGYRPEYPVAEDMDLFLRLAEIGKLANLPEVLLKYRQHPQASGYEQRSLQIELSNRAVADACDRRGYGEKAKQAGHQLLLEEEPSLAEIHRKWAWWALAAGHLKSARKHAFIAIRHSPINIEGWKLIACVLRGY